MKIGIAGCSGTGKSILAEKLASEFNIPFLPSKDITGDILQREGYDYSSGQQVEKFLATNKLQNEILRRTTKQQSIESFVTDRTALDLASYAIIEMDGALNVQKYIESCSELSKSYDYIIICPWQHCDIIDNKKRTLDPWYQFTVHSVILNSLDLIDCRRYALLTESKWEDRLKEVLEWISMVEEYNK
jgi:adenylate kinase family enzyme